MLGAITDSPASEEPTPLAAGAELSALAITPRKGVIYREGDERLWGALLGLQVRVYQVQLVGPTGAIDGTGDEYEQRDQERTELDRLKRAVADNGGDRLEQLAIQCRDQERERDRRRQCAERHADLLAAIGELPATDEAAFAAQRQQWMHPDSLVRRLAMRPDSVFYDWLEPELARRFDYACCATPEQFRRETRALTRSGQVKAPGERHEKDDRHRLDDRGRYVLGWCNAAKIAALEVQQRALETRLGGVGSSIAKAQAEQSQLRNWFLFAASERWREDGAEYEHYSDSGGKCGGQKEKLAYTILAASLAYQFGLEWGRYVRAHSVIGSWGHSAFPSRSGSTHAMTHSG